jgi:hypothetical protein
LLVEDEIVIRVRVHYFVLHCDMVEHRFSKLDWSRDLWRS